MVKKACGNQKAIIWGCVVALCAAIMSQWFFSDDVLETVDGAFHIARIEGIAEGLRAGDFPVRIYPFQYNGYGDPVGIFYPDLLLYFPALLRIAGASAGTAYNAYWIFVIFSGMLCSWFAYSRMSGSPRAGAVSAALYHSSFIVAAPMAAADLGAFSSACFFPLAFYGVWSVLFEKEGYKEWPIAVVGFTIILETHVLNSILLIFSSAVLCAVSWERFKSSDVRRAAFFAAAATFCLNAWRYVPLTYMYRSLDFKIKTPYVSSLHDMTCNLAGMTEAQFWIGWPIILLSLLSLTWLFLKGDRAEFFGFLKIFSICVLLSFFMFDWFPWKSIESIPIIGQIFPKFQFAFRFLPAGMVFLALRLGSLAGRIFSGNAVAAALCAAASITGIYSVGHISYHLAGTHIEWQPSFSAAELVSYGPKIHEDYLYNDISFGDLKNVSGNILGADDLYSEAIIEDVIRRGTNFRISYKSEKDSEVQLPLFYYPGYKALDEKENPIKIREGKNHIMFVELPKGNSEITVRYSGLTLFRLADALSLISLFVFSAYFIKHWRFHYFRLC